jgi:hypothetical protein
VSTKATFVLQGPLLHPHNYFQGVIMTLLFVPQLFEFDGAIGLSLLTPERWNGRFLGVNPFTICYFPYAHNNFPGVLFSRVMLVCFRVPIILIFSSLGSPESDSTLLLCLFFFIALAIPFCTRKHRLRLARGNVKGIMLLRASTRLHEMI